MDFSGIALFLYLTSFSLLAAVGVPLPFSVPPLPEEPALLRIAPSDSIAFVAWSGAAAPDPTSPNRTERLCAEPEVQHMVMQLRTALAGMIGAEARGGGGLPLQLFQVGTAALQRPGCVFLRSLQLQPRRSLAGGIAVHFDKGLAGAKAVMGALELQMGRNRGSREWHEDVVVGDVTFHAMPTDTDHPFLGWTELDGWFLLAVGRDTPEAMVAGLRQQSRGLDANAAYQGLAPACAVARPVTRAFVDLQRVRELLAANGAERPQALLDALGLGKATAAVACSGLEGQGFASRLRIATPEHTGWLGVFDGAPLGQDGLSRIPIDADLAVSARIDLVAAERAMLGTLTAIFGERVLAEYEREVVGGFEATFGISWRNDLLAHGRGQLAAWDAPSQGGALFTGTVATLELVDGAAFGTAMAKVMAELARKMPSKEQVLAAGERLQRRRQYLESFRHGDRLVHWLDNSDNDFPFAVSWTATDRHLIAGLTPQVVREVLDTDDPPNPDHSLVKLPVINRRGKATALLTWSAPEVLAAGYAPLLVLLQAAGSEWQREGFDFDIADVPRRSSLLPHLDREVLLLEPLADGWAVARTGTLPLADPLLLAAAWAFIACCNEM